MRPLSMSSAAARLCPMKLAISSRLQNVQKRRLMRREQVGPTTTTQASSHVLRASAASLSHKFYNSSARCAVCEPLPLVTLNPMNLLLAPSSCCCLGSFGALQPAVCILMLMAVSMQKALLGGLNSRLLATIVSADNYSNKLLPAVLCCALCVI